MSSPVLAMSSSKVTGYVHSLETFGSVDGPGVRFIVFLQGCNLRCRYCHNPETWCGGGEPWKAEDLFERAWRYRNYWGKGMKNGGITVSGGEPLLQMEFVTEFFRLAKEKGVHTTLDTAGEPFRTEDAQWLAFFDELLKYTDLVMLDLKEMDEKKHIRLTGRTNQNILAMAQYLSDHGTPMWIRHVLVPDLTDGEKDLKQMNQFIQGLKTVEKVEILPYHSMGIYKWDKLGITYTLKDARTPTDEEIERAKELLGVIF